MLVSGGFFDPENLQKELVQLEEQLQDPDVWKDHKKLNSLNKEKTAFQSKLDEFNALESKFSDIKDLIEISIELNDEEELQKQETALLMVDSEIEHPGALSLPEPVQRDRSRAAGPALPLRARGRDCLPERLDHRRFHHGAGSGRRWRDSST